MRSREETSLRIPGYRHLHNGHSISRLEGGGNYTLMHLSHNPNKPLLVSQSLKRFEFHFPHCVRISKSFMVNPKYVEQVIHENSKVMSLKLTDGLNLGVARRRISETLARLGQT